MGISSKNKDNKGFTILELMVTVAIAGILVAIAMPNFTSTIKSNRLTTINNDLVSALNLARSEAVKRNQQVVVRRDAAGWQKGWQVFVDIDRSAGNADIFNDDSTNPLCESDEDCLLRVYPELPTGNYTLQTDNFTNFVRYTPTGQISLAGGGSFAICEDNDVATSREIVILATGRAQSDGGNTCSP
jgi:type IV fimbrial biogenesis protein FimT